MTAIPASFPPAGLTPSQEAARQNVLTLERQLNASLAERGAPIRGILAALLAGEHVLLLGPPGTAKSTLARGVCRALGGGYFERLMTKFSVPEELFGPISIQKLQADKFERLTAGYLPEARVAFIDEVFKANSAILNSMLTLLNEREYDNGSSRMQCPLEIAIGASNELPQDDSLYALYDRFVLRYYVEPIRGEGAFRDLLSGRGANPLAGVQITLTQVELADLRDAVAQVQITGPVLDGVLTLRSTLAKEHGITASDRRWVKIMNIARANAVLSGRTQVTGADMMVCSAALWRTPEEAPVALNATASLVSPLFSHAMKIADQASELFSKIDFSIKTPAATTGLMEATKAMKGMIQEMERMAKQDPTADISAQIEQVRAMQGQLATRVKEALGV